MNSPAISVVMATYNGEKYLTEQLESILLQTLPPVEIIVCDDRSNDGTVAILESFKKKGLLSYYVNDDRLGVINNFKKAASFAKSTNLLAFADQDDIWLPYKLQTLAEKLLEHTDQNLPAMVFSDLTIINKAGAILNYSLWKEFTIDPDKQTFKTLLTRNIVPGCTMLINSNMRKELLTMPNTAYMHDAWLTFVAYAFKNYAYVKQPLICYRQHDNNVTYSESSAMGKPSFISKINEYIGGTLLNKPLLNKELILAEEFLSRFKPIMEEEDIKTFKNFLKLKNANFLRKKMHIRYINDLERP
jgi:glycosyltransferase involved in cell wall biosynthesis